ncbi:peptidoglycan DD-metalloendopeptidase family protein [Vreelandella sp. EE22]
MRKVLTLSLLALAISGCANQQSHTPQVRDLSEARRAVESSPQYTVEPGDTLYGIAWEHDLDYRELAALNSIDPPYQIRPGQTIALRQGAGNTPTGSQGASPGGQSGQPQRGAVATGLNAQSTSVASNQNAGTGNQDMGGSNQSNDQQMDWLLPDESAIERNQRITAERGENAENRQEPSAPSPQPEQDGPQADVVDAQPAVAQVSQEPTPEPEPRREPEPEPQPESEPQPEPAPAAEPEPEPAAAPAQPDRSSRSFTPVDDVNWRWPTDGQVSGGFGEGETITAGIDITGQKGQPVRAAGPGIVVYAGSGVRGYGNLILLKHNDQYLSAYAHNDSLRVSENDVVEAGEVIATMGDSDSDSVKLHFEVRRDGQPQNPLDFLPSR